jgi:hypothetical protein
MQSILHAFMNNSWSRKRPIVNIAHSVSVNAVTIYVKFARALIIESAVDGIGIMIQVKSPIRRYYIHCIM